MARKKKVAKKAAPRRAAKPAAKKSSARAAGGASARSRKPAAKKVARPAPRAAPRPKWKPEGMQDTIVNLVFKEATRAIEFYKNVFGARELMRMMSPDGRNVWHAELKIGDSVLFLNDEAPMSPCVAPGPQHPPTASLQLYVPDCDAVFNRAVQAGAKPAMPLADMFWGDRMGSVIDPFGQVWMLSTRVRVLSEEQMRKGGEEFAAEFAARHSEQQGGAQPPAPASGAHHEHGATD